MRRKRIWHNIQPPNEVPHTSHPGHQAAVAKLAYALKLVHWNRPSPLQLGTSSLRPRSIPKSKLERLTIRSNARPTAVAERVMRMPDPQSAHSFAAMLRPHCGALALPVNRKTRRRKSPRKESSPGSTAGPLSAPPIVHEVLRSPGHPLDTSSRSFMEPRFGHGFGGFESIPTVARQNPPRQ